MMRCAWLVIILAASATAEELRGKVTQVVAGAIYIDVGSARGLASGDAGEVRRAGTRVADVAVITVSGSQARLSISRSTRRPVLGDEVVLFTQSKKKAESAKQDAKRPTEEEPFQPLLERQKLRAKPVAKRNIFHGRVSFQQLVQIDNEGDFDYSTSLLSSDGMFDRIGGSPWSLNWAGNLYYRTGDAFEGTELEGDQLILFGLSFARPLADGGFLRFGRFLPRAMSGAGYLDGAAIETSVGQNTNLGAAFGFKPTRLDLSATTDEPTGLVYASYAAGTRGDAYSSGSYGVLVSGWESRLDRTALLLEQVVERGKARLDATATVDFDVGGAEFHEGVRLTRMDAVFSWRHSRATTFRAGADRWERLDTAAERAQFEALGPLLFDSAFWRPWVGAVFVLPAHYRLDLEYAQIHGDDGSTTAPWRATLEKFDPFGIAGANMSFTVYNLEGLTGDGYGGLMNTSFPFAAGTWTLGASAGFRLLDTNDQELDVTDVRLSVDHLLGSGWQLSGGVHWVNGTAVDSLLLEFRVDYRF